MKKYILTLLTISVILASCNKQEIENEEVVADKSVVENPNTSYTGESFTYDSEYINPKKQIGMYHNEVMDDLSKNLDQFEDLDDLLHQLYISTSEATELTNLEIDEDEFSDAIKELGKLGEQDFDYQFYRLNNEYGLVILNGFSVDIENLCNELDAMPVDMDAVNYCDAQISIIEQKVNASQISESDKGSYLTFCAVFRESFAYRNLVIANPGHPLFPYYFDGTKAEPKVSVTATIAADCYGALEGGLKGAFFGPAAALFLAVGEGAIASLGAASLSIVYQVIDDYFGW
ncbi:MAG: hypothetical protein ACOC3T_05685 [Bacteroidota bacterium]